MNTFRKKPRGAKTLPGSPMGDVGWVSISVFQACALLCSIFQFLFRCLKYFRTKLSRYWSTNYTLQSIRRTGLDFWMFWNRGYNYHFLNTILSGRSNAQLTVGPLTCSSVASVFSRKQFHIDITGCSNCNNFNILKYKDLSKLGLSFLKEI